MCRREPVRVVAGHSRARVWPQREVIGSHRRHYRPVSTPRLQVTFGLLSGGDSTAAMAQPLGCIKVSSGAGKTEVAAQSLERCPANESATSHVIGGSR